MAIPDFLGYSQIAPKSDIIDSYQKGLNAAQAQQINPIKLQQAQADVTQTQANTGLTNQQTQNAQTTNQTNQVALAQSKLSALSGLLSNVKDDQSYQAAGQVAKQMGLPVDQFLTQNPTYGDGSHVEALKNTIAGQTERLDLQAKQAGIGVQNAQANNLNSEAQLNPAKANLLKAQTAESNAKAVQDNAINQSMLGVGTGGTGGAGHLDENGQPVTGDSFLQSLPSQRAAQIKAYAEGRASPPTGRATTPAMQQLTEQQILQYDPQADVLTRKQRSDTIDDFSKGQSGRELKNLGTVAGHIDNLADLGSKLNNGPSDTINSITNSFGQHVQNKAVLNPYNLQKSLTSDEIVSLITGGKGSEKDREAIAKTLSSDASDEDRNATLSAAVKAAYDRTVQLAEKYKSGMGRTSGTSQVVKEVVPPEAAALFQKYGLDTTPLGYTPPPKAQGEENIPNGGIVKPSQPGLPQPTKGLVRNGYIFLGGDPANQQSWKQVK